MRADTLYDSLLSALAALHEREAGLLAVARRDRIAREVVLAATIEPSMARPWNVARWPGTGIAVTGPPSIATFIKDDQ